MEQKTGYWGYHLTLDCRACDLEKIKSAENITQFAKELVKRIDMIAYGEPQVVFFGKEDKSGYTLVQLIETSNITAHFCDETREGYIDVFSCKEYDIETVVATVEEFFSPERIRPNFITRQA